ncbi:MAG: nitrogen fixation negative regulator NifL [Corallincola sp.]|nr:nitrogen fixation negative regulator NifL [Corallincola sp.]
MSRNSAWGEAQAALPLAMLAELAVEQAPMAISMTALDAHILYVNQCFCDTTGYSREQLLGANHSLISYRATPKSIYEEMWRTITAGQVWRGKLLNRRANGERYLAEVTIAPLTDGKGAISHFLGMHRDISESHLLATRLSNERAQLEAVINAAPQAMALLDPGGAVVLDNLAYKTLSADLGDEPASRVLAQLGERSGSSHSQFFEWPTSRGQRILQAHLERLETVEPAADAFFAPRCRTYRVLTLIDQTRTLRQQEQHRLDQLQLLTAHSELVHALQESLQAALMQLQPPLNLIRAALAVMDCHDHPCNGVAPMRMALEAGEQASSRLRAALPERPLEAVQPVNLNQILHDVLQLEERRAMALGIEVSWQPQPDLPMISGQPGRLRLACKQLLANALEAIERNRSRDRRVVLSSWQQGDEVGLTVDDSGPGIPADERHRVFEPFHTSKGSSQPGARGLGLSLVQQIVNEHAATILLTDSPLGGCRVELRLPASGRLRRLS